MPSVFVVVNITSLVDSVLQSTWLATSLTCAVGFTVIVKVSEGPVHSTSLLVNVGVTTIVAVSEVVPAIAVKLGMFPSPLAPNPILVLLFVQA